jgi:hypothetical protein
MVKSSLGPYSDVINAFETMDALGSADGLSFEDWRTHGFRTYEPSECHSILFGFDPCQVGAVQPSPLTDSTSVYARVFFQARDLVHRSMRFLPDAFKSEPHENSKPLKLPYWYNFYDRMPVIATTKPNGSIDTFYYTSMQGMSYRDVFFLASLAGGKRSFGLPVHGYKLTTALILSTLCFVRTFGYSLTPVAQRRLITLQESSLEKRRDTTSQRYRQFMPYRDSIVEPIVSLEGCLLDFVEAE